MDGYLPCPERRDGRAGFGRRTGLRRTLRRAGAEPIVLLGFLLELGWAFVGSLGLGLGVSSSPAGPLRACLWLGGAFTIAAAAAGAAFLASPGETRDD